VSPLWYGGVQQQAGRPRDFFLLKLPSIRQYFVDEAGDGTLFDRKGRVLIETEGCSRYFMLGVIDVPDPLALQHDMDTLRARLLSDPYFKGAPSFHPETQKTALAFHAKDDLPEVRREVFALLLQHSVRFLAVVRDKQKLLEYVRLRNEREATY
jgi:hypothetical protein